MTIRYPHPIKTDWEHYNIIIHLNSSLEYEAFFHDPNFFLLSGNLRSVPHARIKKERKMLHNRRELDYFPIIVTQRVNINRPGKSCVEDVNYSFENCISNRVMNSIGCKYPWNNQERNFHACKTAQKIFDLEQLFFEIGKMEQRDIVLKTGCNIPCRFYEYSILSDIMKGLQVGFGIGMVFPSTDIKVEEEEFIYPLVSFVSEFGGALGLFLGFSFLMVGDFMYCTIVALVANLK